MRIDPGDDCTFWYTAEYPGETKPATRISAFRLPGCGAQTDLWLSVLPPLGSVTAGGSAGYRIDTSGMGVADGVTLSVSGLPPGTSGLIEPASVNAGESATLTVTASGDAAATPSTTFTISATGGPVVARAVAQLQVRRDDAPADGADAGTDGVDAGSPDGHHPPAPTMSASGCSCNSSQAPLEILSALLAWTWIQRALRARARKLPRA
jgi:hypothetical protein